MWTYTAICADTKLIFSWLVGSRSHQTTTMFMKDVASRLPNRVQLSTDGLSWYMAAVENAFGYNGCDFGQIIKEYATEAGKRGKFVGPSICVGVEKVSVMGTPNMKLVSTSYVERSNLQIRTNIRCFTRSTNAFSKKAENHAHSVSLHFMCYNFMRTHGTLTKANGGIKMTPAMAAGITNHVWTVEEMLEKMAPTYQIAA